MPATSDYTVVIAEDDAYSCDLMAFLLARDRRIRVVAEGPDALHAIEQTDPAVLSINLILLDTEVPGDEDQPFLALRRLRYRNDLKIVCTGTHLSKITLHKARSNGACGYVLKDEVHYALGEVVVQAMEGNWVASPSVMALARQSGVTLPQPVVVISGARRLDRLDGRDREIARLAILFNQPYKDIADELGVGAGHVGDLVSDLYDKIGLIAILDGQKQAADLFEHPEILEMFERAAARRREKRNSGAELKTLAFHLLTLPEIETVQAGA